MEVKLKKYTTLIALFILVSAFSVPSNKINSISADFRITKELGVKTLKQLMDEQNPQVIPNGRRIKTIFFLVSAEDSNLIVSSTTPVQPGFRLVIKSGDDKTFPISPTSVPLDALQVVESTTLSTGGVCNFFVHLELD